MALYQFKSRSGRAPREQGPGLVALDPWPAMGSEPGGLVCPWIQPRSGGRPQPDGWVYPRGRAWVWRGPEPIGLLAAQSQRVLASPSSELPGGRVWVRLPKGSAQCL